MFKNDFWLTEASKINCFNVSLPHFYKESLKKKKNFLISCKIRKTKSKFLKINTEKTNFKFIGENVIFQKKISIKGIKLNNEINFKKSQKNEKKKLINFCQQNMKSSRFDLDRRIPKHIVKRIRKKWISSYFLKLKNKEIFSIYKKKTLVGLLCVIKRKNNLIIDLIAVSKNQIGKNIGKSIIENLQIRFPKFKNIIVGTYNINKRAMNFYRNNKFKKVRSYMVYHFYER